MRFSRIAFGSMAGLIAVALVVQMVLLAQGGVDANTGNDTSDVGYATRLVRLYSFFTIQSNVLVLLATASLALRPGRDGRLWRVLHLDALLGIVITGIVFDLVLADQVHLTGWAYACTIVFHYVAPWVTLALWLAFGPRPRIDWDTIAWAFVWPVAWIVYTFVHGAVSGFWPYPFLDAEAKGYPTALLNTGAVVVLAALLALAFRALDRLPTLGSERG